MGESKTYRHKNGRTSKGKKWETNWERRMRIEKERIQNWIGSKKVKRDKGRKEQRRKRKRKQCK
jgi:hypothetical protein